MPAATDNKYVKGTTTLKEATPLFTAAQQYVVLQGELEGGLEEACNALNSYQYLKTEVMAYQVKGDALIATPLQLSKKDRQWLGRHPECQNPQKQDVTLIKQLNAIVRNLQMAGFKVEYWSDHLKQLQQRQPAIVYDVKSLDLTKVLLKNDRLQIEVKMLQQITEQLQGHVAVFKGLVSQYVQGVGALQANRGIVAVATEHKNSPCTTPCSQVSVLSSTGRTTPLTVNCVFVSVRGGNSPETARVL